MAEDPYQKKADVSSLDQDLRELRRSKYNKDLADQAKQWIFDRIGESVPQQEDLIDVLKDGVKYGVPEDEVFQTIDLYEENDPTIVLQTIVSFSRYVHTKTPSIPVIGPKLSTKQPPPKVPKKPQFLNDPKWSSFEYGYMKGASQSSEGCCLW
ncbi:unnamed protein product [Wickerhamomyces anomalus]